MNIRLLISDGEHIMIQETVYLYLMNAIPLSSSSFLLALVRDCFLLLLEFFRISCISNFMKSKSKNKHSQEYLTEIVVFNGLKVSIKLINERYTGRNVNSNDISFRNIVDVLHN